APKNAVRLRTRADADYRLALATDEPRMTALAPDAHRALVQALGGPRVQTDPPVLELYASDEGPRRCRPLAVIFPAGHDDVVALVRVANEFRLPLVARGGGSGNVGGALPVPSGLVVSFECMRRTIDFSPAERLIV